MTTAPVQPRSWLRPRYSLRVLLLAFTAFAIGFPIWYRWPYEEREILASSPPSLVTVTTWQRQWGGGRLKHGPERFLCNNDEFEFTMYVNGQKNGLYKRYAGGPFDKPELFCVGQYVDDLKEGVWIEYFSSAEKEIKTWHHGRQISPPVQWADWAELTPPSQTQSPLAQ